MQEAPVMYGRDPRFEIRRAAGVGASGMVPFEMYGMVPSEAVIPPVSDIAAMGRGKRGGKKGGEAKSDYFDYVRAFQAEHPGMSWQAAVKKAADSYHKMNGTVAAGKKKVKKGGVKVNTLGEEVARAALADEMSKDVVKPYIQSMKTISPEELKQVALESAAKASGGSLLSFLGLGDCSGSEIAAGMEANGIDAGSLLDFLGLGKSGVKAGSILDILGLGKAGVKAGSLLDILGLGMSSGVEAGSILDIFGLGKPGMKREHKIMGKALAAGILDGGEESHAKRKMAAVEGYLEKYKDEKKKYKQKYKAEKKKLAKLKGGKKKHKK